MFTHRKEAMDEIREMDEYAFRKDPERYKGPYKPLPIVGSSLKSLSSLARGLGCGVRTARTPCPGAGEGHHPVRSSCRVPLVDKPVAGEGHHPLRNSCPVLLVDKPRAGEGHHPLRNNCPVLLVTM